MDDRFVLARMAPILLLILGFAAPQAPASPSKDCLPELLISVDLLAIDRARKKELLLVDIRPVKAFEKLRIPGSLNVPAFAIKTKTFFKKYDLVLVDEGYRYAQIEEECRRLRRSGFRLRILNGGLSAWNRKGGALEGDDFARKALNRLSPLQFFPEKDCGNWIVLDVAEGRQPEVSCLFPRVVSIPYAGDDKIFAARYEEILKRQTGMPCIRILVADERGEHYDQLERVIRTTAYPQGSRHPRPGDDMQQRGVLGY